MAGGPSQVDLFDYKPKLAQLDGQPIPDSFIQGERFAFIKGIPKILASPHNFKQYGQSGATISNLLPGLQSIADEVTFIKSMHTTQFNHSPAQIYLSTGSGPTQLRLLAHLRNRQRQQRSPPPSWFCYRVRVSPMGTRLLVEWDEVPFRKATQFSSFPTRPACPLQRSDARFDDQQPQSPNSPTSTIPRFRRQFPPEMAYKMQTSVPDLQDRRSRSPFTRWHGTTPGQPSFASNCLLARRLVERGVRFVQLFHRDWDTHELISTTTS